MRVSADGYIDLRDPRRVRTPGFQSEDDNLVPVPEGEALSFLLSHSFPGHRRVVRSLTVDERKRIRLALWADSVSERMALVDRIWRAITEPVAPPPNPLKPYLIQVVQFEVWVYPIYLDGNTTRVIPLGGKPLAELDRAPHVLRLDRMTA
jgi:hypothetical protein